MVTLYVFIISADRNSSVKESKQHIPFIKKQTASERLLPYSASKGKARQVHRETDTVQRQIQREMEI